MRRHHQHQHVHSSPEQAHRPPFEQRCSLGKAAVGVLVALFVYYGAVFLWEEGTFPSLRNNKSNYTPAEEEKIYFLSSKKSYDHHQQQQEGEGSPSAPAAPAPAARAPAAPAAPAEGKNNRTSSPVEGEMVLHPMHRHPHPHKAGNTTRQEIFPDLDPKYDLGYK